MSEYKPGTYEKNGRIRVALSAREAVALAFEGYKPVAEQPAVAAAEAKLAEPVIVDEPALEQPVVDEPEVAETPAPKAPKTPTPTALARKQSQEDDKS